ncbi:MAG: hypothetical protein IIZ19_10095, partial [Clostridia bacterium]|nr:hypothetical protein [Clostridia bacterium]
RPVVLIIALVAAALLILDIAQFIGAQNDRSLAADREAALNKTIDNYEEQVADLRYKNTEYDVVKQYIDMGNIGYGSERFRTDKGVIVLKKYGGGSEKLTLTTKYNDYVTIDTIYTNNGGSVARASFDHDEWYGDTTTLTVRPISRGVELIRFENDVDSTFFYVIVIVE